MDRRRSRRLIFAAVIVGLMLRLAFALLYWTDKPLTQDEREYLALAGSLATGQGFHYTDAEILGTARRFARAPGYPAMLSLLGVDGSATSAPVIVKIVQSLLGAVAIWLIGVIAERAFDSRAAVLAAAIAAVYPPLVWLPSYVFSEAVYLPMALVCVFVLTAAARLRTAVGAGLIAGLTSLVRSSMLSFVPLAALWLAWRRRLALGVAFFLVAAVTILPWTVRNWREHGRLIVVAADGGVTFWTGNHPLARGEGDLAANPALKAAEVEFRTAHSGLTAEQLEPLYYADALRRIRENPAWWLTLVARKAFYALVPIGPSYTLHSTRYLVASVVSYAMLAPLAVAGILIIARNGNPPEPLYLMAASVVLTSLIFFPQERFRLPVIDPLMIICAAAAVSAAVRRNA